MTHQIFNPDTNTMTTDPEEVARHVVIPGREGTSLEDPPRIIVSAGIDDEDAQEHWLWLHPAQALAVGKRLIDLATAAHDPARSATTFPVVDDRPHLTIAGQGGQ